MEKPTDALKNPIKIGKKYGFTHLAENGILYTKFGTAHMILENDMVVLKLTAASIRLKNGTLASSKSEVLCQVLPYQLFPIKLKETENEKLKREIKRLRYIILDLELDNLNLTMDIQILKNSMLIYESNKDKKIECRNCGNIVSLINDSKNGRCLSCYSAGL
jgi:hypothetical protein